MTPKRAIDKLSADAHPLSADIGALDRERAELWEEVLQLKAAVHIWSEVCRELKGSSGCRQMEPEVLAG